VLVHLVATRTVVASERFEGLDRVNGVAGGRAFGDAATVAQGVFKVEKPNESTLRTEHDCCLTDRYSVPNEQRVAVYDRLNISLQQSTRLLKNRVRIARPAALYGQRRSKI
jgi:hypothetical protein